MSLGKLKWGTLFAISGTIGLGIGVIGLLLDREKDKYANNAKFVKRAIEIMQKQPQVKSLIGESVEIGQATFKDRWSRINEKEVRIKVPVKGENDNAELFAYAIRRASMNDKLDLYKLEAKFEKIKGKRLVILDRLEEINQAEAAYNEQKIKEQERLKQEEEEMARLRKEDRKLWERKEAQRWQWKDRPLT